MEQCTITWTITCDHLEDNVGRSYALKHDIENPDDEWNALLVAINDQCNTPKAIKIITSDVN